MASIILHIGTHKTGTTSVQRSLAGSQSELLRQGFAYPISGRTNPLGREMLKHGLLFRDLHRDDKRREESWVALSAELDSRKVSTAILSNEHLSHEDLPGIERVAQYLVGHDVQIVLYLRDPVGYMASAYNQEVKRAGLRLGFVEYLELYKDRCNYLELISRWASTFSAGSLVVRIFERAREIGLLQDFANVAGLDVGEMCTISRENESPSSHQLRAILRLNRLRLTSSAIRGHVASGTAIGRLLTRVVNPLGTPVSYGWGQEQLRVVQAWGKQLCGSEHLSEEQAAFVQAHWMNQSP